MNEIKTMMKEDAGVDYIHEGVAEFQKILDEFKMCHESVQKMLPDDVRENETLDWYEPKMANYTTFLTEVEKWSKSQLDPQTLVDATDSVSKVSMTSSKASSISSARMKAAADKAALLARAEALKRKHELELEKLQLSAKMESLEMETDIAATNAKLKALEEFENMEQISKPGGIGMEAYQDEYVEGKPPGPEEQLETRSSVFGRTDVSLSQLDFAGLGAVPKTPLQTMMQAHQNHQTTKPQAKNESTVEESAAATATPRTTKVVVSDGPHRQDQSTPRSEIPQSLDLTRQRQTDLVDLLVMQQKQASLPRREVPVFDGNPLTFRLFTQAFKHNIEDKTNSNEDRLYFLEQYTVGQPKELVRSCFHMNATTGYAEAKRLLKHHFGDDFKITTAYIEKALNWNSIRTDDGKALHSYALYLRRCGNAVQDLIHDRA